MGRRPPDPRAHPAAALDANFGALLAWYASWSGGEIVARDDLLLTWSGVRFRAINAASMADLDGHGANVGQRDGGGRSRHDADIRDRIEEAASWLAARTDRWRWLVGPTSRPPDLAERLLAAGLRQTSDTPGMALDLRGWEIGEAAPGGVTIDPVVDESGLAAWREVQRRGLALEDASAEAWWMAHRREGFEAGQPLTNWVAWLDGVPVAAAALFVGAGVAGIYNVCTAPEARGRGIGRAVTVAAIDEGARLGLPIAVLGASEMGFPVYRRLGFREVSRLRSYTRDPG